MPKAIFTIEGEIEDFTRIDNIYRSLKKEGDRLLKKWKLKFDVQYEETEGEGEIPQ